MSYPRLSYHWFIFISSIFIVLCLNTPFFSHFKIQAQSAGFDYLMQGWQITLVFIVFLSLLLELLCVRWNAKIILSFVLLISSVCGFYMHSLGILIDEGIVQSVFETHLSEALDMVSAGMILWVLGFGILPCIILWKLPLKHVKFFKGVRQKVMVIIGLLTLLGIGYGFWGKDLVFVFKSQKTLIFMPNPIAPIRSLVLYIQHSKEKHFALDLIAQDAKLSEFTPPQIVVFVIGESARSANFSLNGYARQTNPYTAMQNVISFKEFYSCGVITAISVPCMLTYYTQKTYTHRNLSFYTNNILEIAQDLGYEVWYLGNNGGKCVGGCERNIQRVKYYEADSLDGVMLPDIEHIISQAQNPTFIVVHQYGSHGASYFNRYPSEFEFFTPVCKQKELSKCTQDEIINAYDNSLRYSDYVLSQIIDLLRASKLRTMLWYVSDHGESLGEFGQYMHGGFGYSLSPAFQRHIPSIMWFSDGWGDLQSKAEVKIDAELNHNFVFYTLLHLLGIETKDYDLKLDIFSEGFAK